MVQAHAVAFAIAAVLLASTRAASADPSQAPAVLAFGVPVPVALQTVEPAHFVYMPVLGPWMDIARQREATGALLFDGVLQDVVALTFVTAFRSAPLVTVGWSFTPWFPQSGGGGFSLKATF